MNNDASVKKDFETLRKEMRTDSTLGPAVVRSYNSIADHFEAHNKTLDSPDPWITAYVKELRTQAPGIFADAIHGTPAAGMTLTGTAGGAGGGR